MSDTPHASPSGMSAGGAAVAAGFLVLFLSNSSAPDTTKFAVIVGLITFFVVRSQAKKAAGGHGGH